MLNVLLITADQWRGDCLGCVGHPCVRTPHLDELSQHAVVFRRHFAGAAPCSPARACLYTGLYQMNNRVCRNGTPLDARHDNIAKALRRLGYDPTLLGYTDSAPDPRMHAENDPALTSYEGILPGFYARMPLHERAEQWISWLKEQGVALPADLDRIDLPVDAPPDPPSPAPPLYSRDQTRTAFIANEFLRWLGEQDGARPWCAHVSILSPHPPFVVPEPYNTMFDADGVPAPLDRADWRERGERHPFLKWVHQTQPKRQFVAGTEGLVHEWSEADILQLRAIYYGMIAEVDAQLGRVFDGLRASGAWERTLIMFTSDHGEMLGDHGQLGKMGFYDQGYHIPLMIRHPDMKRTHGSSVGQFTEAVDVTPTIIDLCGGTPSPAFDGMSLRPFLEGGAPEIWRDAAHWEFDFRDVSGQKAEQHFGLSSQECNLAVLRDERYKYVHFAGMPSLLFDLKNDPDEVDDLAGKPDYAAVRAEYAERMLQWRARHLDRTLALTELTARGPVSVYVR